jgi:hypothetical protein
LFEVKIKNKPNTFFPKSFADELGRVQGLDLSLDTNIDNLLTFFQKLGEIVSWV